MGASHGSAAEPAGAGASESKGAEGGDLKAEEDGSKGAAAGHVHGDEALAGAVVHTPTPVVRAVAASHAASAAASARPPRGCVLPGRVMVGESMGHIITADEPALSADGAVDLISAKGDAVERSLIRLGNAGGEPELVVQHSWRALGGGVDGA